MKKSMFIKKIILFIALISFILSCNNSQNYNHNVNANNKRYSDIIFEDIIEENIINENVLEENILEENIIYENILEEDIIYETLINEIEILENILDENVILESAIAEVSTIEELERNIKNKEYSDDFWQDIDWAPVITKFAVGTSVIIITAVLSVATIDTPLHVVFLSSFKGAVKGASIGAPSGAAINSLTQIALNGGKIDGWQKYAIEGAADGFMYGAITGAITGVLSGYKEFEYRKKLIKHRPTYRKGVVEEVWNNAKGPDGKVRDPNTGDIIDWKPGMPRKDVWDMGHKPGEEYRKLVDRFRRGKITKKEFFDMYNDPKNYRPELPSINRSGKFEAP